jgi:hypothetical protein
MRGGRWAVDTAQTAGKEPRLADSSAFLRGCGVEG